MVVAVTEADRSAAMTSSMGATADRSSELTVLTVWSARRCPRGRSGARTSASATSGLRSGDEPAAGGGEDGEVVLVLEAALLRTQPKDELQRSGVDGAADAEPVRRVEQRVVHLRGDV